MEDTITHDVAKIVQFIRTDCIDKHSTRLSLMLAVGHTIRNRLWPNQTYSTDDNLFGVG